MRPVKAWDLAKEVDDHVEADYNEHR